MNSRDRDARASRFARYVAERGWLHLTLICGIAIFLFPMLWMIAVSMKTDDELLDPGWLPSLPRFVGKSPYVLPPPAIVRPVNVSEAAWRQKLPLIKRISREMISATMPADDVALVDAATAALVNRIAPRISIKMWETDEPQFLIACRGLLIPALVNDAIDNRLARFELTGVLMRSLDGRLFKLCDAKDCADRFVVESGNAAIERTSDGTAYLRYTFTSSSSPAVVLRFDFDSPAGSAQLHKLLFGYIADDSWNRIDATISIGNVTCESQRTTWAAQHRPGSIIFQPPSFDDETFKNRLWVRLRQVAGNPTSQATQNGAQRGTLRLVISPSSTLQAIAGKVQFNYARALRAVPFWRYVGNSLILVILTTLGTLFSSTFIAYAFARLRWPGRSLAFVLLLATMMLPQQVTMIPSFMVWRKLGWYNTLNPLWVPAFFGWAFFVFLMVQQMRTIPRDLEEAARIDGLSALQTWWYVIVPLVKPAAAAIAIMTVMAAWNEFMGPLIYLRDQSRFPLSLGLFAMRIDNPSGATDWTMIMAGNVLMTLPMVLVFIVFQRQFIQGMTMSGMKG